jgi:hypothetical protein
MEYERRGERKPSIFALEITSEHYTKALRPDSVKCLRLMPRVSGSAFVLFAWDHTRLVYFFVRFSASFEFRAIQRVQNTSWTSLLLWCFVKRARYGWAFSLWEGGAFSFTGEGHKHGRIHLHTHAYSTRLRRLFTAEIKSITIS